MNHHLPPELLEIIIDYLSNDVHALAACSLASSIFLDKSRTYLFQSVTLSPRSKHPQVSSRETNSHTGPLSALIHKVSLSTHRSSASRNRCHALYNLLRRSPHLGTYIRSLSLDMDVRSPVLTEPTLKEVFSFLVNLNSLKIRGLVFWEELHQSSREALAYAFTMRSLTHLTFDGGNLHVDRLSELTEPLTCLVFNRAVLYEDLPDYVEDRTKARKKVTGASHDESLGGAVCLEELTIIDYYTRIYDSIAIFGKHVLDTWTPSRLNMSRIRSLTLSAPLNHLVTETQQVIDACSQSVQSIRLTEEHSDLDQTLDLSNCKNLKILNFTYHLYSPTMIHIVPFWWKSTLSTIVTPIRRIEIYICSEYSLEHSLKKSDLHVGDQWREIGFLLSSSRFGEVSVFGDDEAIEDALKDELALFHAER